MEKCQREQDGSAVFESAYRDIGAAGDASNIARAIDGSEVVEGPGENIQTRKQQESHLLGRTTEEEKLLSGLRSIKLADYRSDQIYHPKRRASLMKFGLEPFEVENLLISKVKCFLDEPKMKVIKHIVKETVLRENVTGQGKLDKRRSSIYRLFEKSLIPNESDSPNKLKTDTSKQPGVTRFDNNLKKDYHKAQNIFFRSLDAMNLLVLPIDINVDGGYLKRNARMITTAEFCDVVDDVTEMFVKRYSRDLIPVENIHMQAVYESCERICIERLLMNMAIHNDMLDFKSYEKWRTHVLVYSSFAALLYVYLENIWGLVKK
ncbi:uncharacterized protein LOC127718467 [Mytilus californianus]|uniref:uncharacterized protein LOC127718467 n=1 Tax=Mytilus californianus TaxID=6549 RepID=UPI0022460AD9|nr:uncharacterized protein LOC127718467 [Mytilus californianus]